MYFIIAPDCPRIFPSGVTRNGIWPSGDLPAKINEVKKKGYSFENNVQWNPVNMVTNGSKRFGRINRVPLLSGQALKLGRRSQVKPLAWGYAMPMSPTMKQLSMAATNGVIWLVVCIHKVLAILQSWYGASVLLKIGMVFEGL